MVTLARAASRVAVAAASLASIDLAGRLVCFRGRSLGGSLRVRTRGRREQNRMRDGHGRGVAGGNDHAHAHLGDVEEAFRQIRKAGGCSREKPDARQHPAMGARCPDQVRRCMWGMNASS